MIEMMKIYLLILCIIFGVIFFFDFRLFQENYVLLDRCDLRKGVTLEAYHVMSGATTNELVQIKKGTGNESVLINAYENKNRAKMQKIDEYNVRLILRYMEDGLPDTVLLHIQ
jgi:hypothetical protein